MTLFSDRTEDDTVPTRPKMWRPLEEAMGGFDLDPAAGCEPEQIARERYTPEDDGLKQPWFGTVWLNPPFSEKAKWYRRLVDQLRNGDVEAAVAVGPVDPSTQWFHNEFSTADVVGYLEGRDWFYHDSTSFPPMVGVWNPTDEAVDALHGMGVVVRPVGPDDGTTQTCLSDEGVVGVSDE